MIYIDFDEYTEMGGVLDLTAFNRNIDRACTIIDNATKKRIETMEGVPRQVKACCRDLIEYLNAMVIGEKAIISKSQSVDGVSESESYANKAADDMQNDIDNILCDYLLSVNDSNGTAILYRGLNV